MFTNYKNRIKTESFIETSMAKLNIGDTSLNGQITIIDEDRLCYLVKSVSKREFDIRKMLKKL